MELLIYIHVERLEDSEFIYMILVYHIYIFLEGGPKD